MHNDDSSNQSCGKSGNPKASSGSKLTDACAAAIFDLAYCYLLNGEYLRCVELLENNELVYSSLKFRILAA